MPTGRKRSAEADRGFWIGRRAGIERRCHPHPLRHRFAVELEREGAPVSAIRDLLGHSSLAVTDRYLRRSGASEAVGDAYQAYIRRKYGR